jgi:hypothetical protein
VFINSQYVSGFWFAVLAASALAMGGCGSSGSAGGKKPTASSASCSKLQAELTQMERRGLPALAESKNNGKKLSKKQRADVRAYNDLLNDYLGAGCHN